LNDLAIGRLRVQQRLLAAGEPHDHRYDLFISAVSWESRNATAATIIGGSPCPTLLLRFASGRVAMDAAKDTNQAVLTSMCPDYKVLALERSVIFDANADIIATELRERAEAKGTPLRVLVDISCMPKSYISYLVGLGFANGYVSRLDCLYSEGRYNLAGASTQGGPLSVISEGDWSSLLIPYLEAAETFPSQRDLLVILGGEIGFSLPFIERYEPERLGVVFIRDGVDVASLVGSEKAAYEALTSEPALVRADFEIHDVVGVLRHVGEFCRRAERSIVGLAIGSKAQSLALALAALDIENLEVVCRVPAGYSDADVVPTGRVFHYAIEDRFEPSAYF
jgi:hypothetical protein